MLSSWQAASCGELLILITATWRNLQGPSIGLTLFARPHCIASCSWQVSLKLAIARGKLTADSAMSDSDSVSPDLQATMSKPTSCDGSLVALSAELPSKAGPIMCPIQDCHGRYGQRCHRRDSAGTCCPVDHLFDRWVCTSRNHPAATLRAESGWLPPGSLFMPVPLCNAVESVLSARVRPATVSGLPVRECRGRCRSR